MSYQSKCVVLKCHKLCLSSVTYSPNRAWDAWFLSFLNHTQLHTRPVGLLWTSGHSVAESATYTADLRLVPHDLPEIVLYGWVMYQIGNQVIPFAPLRSTGPLRGNPSGFSLQLLSPFPLSTPLPLFFLFITSLQLFLSLPLLRCSGVAN